jgi:predicted hydrocarbon binding protein
VLNKIVEIFANENLNVVSVLHSRLTLQAEATTFIAVDFTDAKVEPEKLLEKILTLEEVKRAELVHPVKGYLVNEKLFPFTVNTTRIICFGPANLRGLFVEFRRKFGDTAVASILYMIGKEVGKRAARVYVKENLGTGSLKDALEYSKAMLLGFGWARVTFLIKNLKRASVILHQNFECEVLKGNIEEKKPTSYYVRGAFEGFIQTITGRKTRVKEVKCLNLGDPHCEFEITLP